MKTYKDYPKYYFTVLEHFQDSSEEITIKGTWGELTSTRHSINRFFQAIAREVGSDPNALQLYRTAEKVRISLSPGRANYSDPATMTIKLDVLYKAMMDAAPRGGK